MSDQRQEMGDSAEELRDQLVMWRRLEERPEWRLMEHYVRSILVDRTEGVMHTRLTSLEAALGQEFIKGECSMAEFLISIPKQQIERIESELAFINKTLEENPNATGSTDDGRDDNDASLDPIDPSRNAFTE